jgi:prepilin-type N-terminal cleavage/methylation domain-containing protein
MMTQRSRSASARRAFSLVELLVVIAVIALVAAVAIPSLSGARNATRAASTQSLMSQIVQAAAQFERDERRMPGYFSPQQMGAADNATRGLSAMQNVMLDLAGGVQGAGGGLVAVPANSDTILTNVGPTNNPQEQVRVDIALIGSEAGNSRGYFVPDRKFFVAQDGLGQQSTSEASHRRLPSVVDAFGNPLLVWVADDTVIGQPTQEWDFAQLNSGLRASFYWVSNAAFLGTGATSTGRRGYDQTGNNLRAGSLLAAPINRADAVRRSLIGILGHPSFPIRTDPAVTPRLPAAPRGTFVVHSAGADGIYYSRRDRGARQFAQPGISDSGTTLNNNHFIDYRVNFAPDPAQPQVGHIDRQGRAMNIDVTAAFDDLLAVGGN